MELTKEKRKLFAQRLKQACIARYGKEFGIGSKLSREVGASVNTTSRWLRGDVMPESDKWAMIAQTLGVSAQWLLGATHEAPDAVARPDDEASEMVSNATRIVFPLVLRIKPDASEDDVVDLTRHAFDQLRSGVSHEHISGEVVARLLKRN